MKAIHPVCAVLAAFCAALAGLGPFAAGTGVAAAPHSGGVPIVRIADRSVRGAAVPTGYEFLGLQGFTDATHLDTRELSRYNDLRR